MKNCPKCGVELNDEAVFCTECGASFEAAPEVETAPEVEAAPEAPKAEAPVAPKKSIAKILGIVGIVLSILPGPWLGTIASIVGIVLGVKEKKETGEKKGLTLSIVGLVLALVLPVLAAILGVVISLISTMLFGGLGFFGELIEEILYSIGLY